ncbi:hypothetical protein FACS1894208_01930 [Clostridia bacterium]|nr:hypothetical protein FACS1894208_01930 [Clostridia bacterium]
MKHILKRYLSIVTAVAMVLISAQFTAAPALAAAAPSVIFSDDFESGSLSTKNWTADADAESDVITAVGPTGQSKVATVKNGSIYANNSSTYVSSAIASFNYTNVVAELSVKVDGVAANDVVKIGYFIKGDGSNGGVLQTITANAAWEKFSFELPAVADNTLVNFYINVTNEVDGVQTAVTPTATAYVDDIVVTAVPIPYTAPAEHAGSDTVTGNPVETRFEDDFEVGSLAAKGWTSNNYASDSLTKVSVTGLGGGTTTAAKIHADTLYKAYYSTKGYKDIYLSYSIKVTDANPDDYAVTGVQLPAMSHVDQILGNTADIAGNQNGWVRKVIALPSGTFDKDSFNIVFYTHPTNTRSNVYIDDVRISGIYDGVKVDLPTRLNTPLPGETTDFENFAVDAQPTTINGWGPWSPTVAPKIVESEITSGVNNKAIFLSPGSGEFNYLTKYALNFTGLEDIQLSFDAKIDGGGTLYIYYTYDGYTGGGNGELAKDIYMVEGWNSYNIKLENAVNSGASNITFAVLNWGGAADTLLDNIIVRGNPINTTPEQDKFPQNKPPVIDNVLHVFYGSEADGALIPESLEVEAEVKTNWFFQDAAFHTDLWGHSGTHAVELAFDGGGGIATLFIDTTALTNYDPTKRIVVTYWVKIVGDDAGSAALAAGYNRPESFAGYMPLNTFSGPTGGWIQVTTAVDAMAYNNEALELRFKTDNKPGSTGRMFVDDVIVVAGDWEYEMVWEWNGKLWPVPDQFNPRIHTENKLPDEFDQGMKDDLPNGMFVTAPAEFYTFGVAVTDTHLYWASMYKGIYRLPLDENGHASLLDEPEFWLDTFGMYEITAANGAVYYAINAAANAGGSIHKVDIETKADTVVVSNITSPREFEVAANGDIYVTTEGGQLIRHIAGQPSGTWTEVYKNDQDSYWAMPLGCAISPTTGKVYFLEFGRNAAFGYMLGSVLVGGRVWEYDPNTGINTIFYGGTDTYFFRGRGLDFAPDGSLLLCNEANAWDQGGTGAIYKLNMETKALTPYVTGLDYPAYFDQDATGRIYMPWTRERVVMSYDDAADFLPQNWSATLPKETVISYNGTYLPAANAANANLTVTIEGVSEEIVLSGIVTPSQDGNKVSGWIKVPVSELDLSLVMHPQPPEQMPNIFDMPTITANADGGSVATAVIPLRDRARARWPMPGLYVDTEGFIDKPKAYLVYFEYKADESESPSIDPPPATPTPSEEITIPANDGAINVVVTVSEDGKVSTVADDEKVAEIVKDAKDTATLDVSSIEDVKSVEVPQTLLTALEKADVTLEIVFSDEISVELNDLALASIAAAGTKTSLVELIAEQIDANNYEFSVKVDGKLVTDFKGGIVIVTVQYTPTSKTVKDEQIVVYYVTDKTKEVASARYHDGIITLQLRHFSKYVVEENPVAYTVTSGWYSPKALDFAVSRGLLNSFIKDGKLNAGQIVTRAEYVAAYLKTLGISPLTKFTAPFKDLGGLDAETAAYVNTAKELGYVSGINEAKTLFDPHSPAVRAHSFAIMYNILKATNTIPTTDSGKTAEEFDDFDKVPAWAKKSTSVLVKTGLVVGDNNKIDSESALTTGMMSALLNKLN